MILYNVTVGIDETIEMEWLKWMKESHIPAVMETGFFNSYKIFKVLGDQEEVGNSYSIQYFAPTIEHLNLYLTEKAPALMKQHHDKYKDKHVAFRTVLQEV